MRNEARNYDPDKSNSKHSGLLEEFLEGFEQLWLV
jgi:hypothetical protein